MSPLFVDKLFFLETLFVKRSEPLCQCGGAPPDFKLPRNFNYFI